MATALKLEGALLCASTVTWLTVAEAQDCLEDMTDSTKVRFLEKVPELYWQVADDLTTAKFAGTTFTARRASSATAMSGGLGPG